MDQRPLPIADSTPYRCPGETYSIERPVHLARLASFYPPCASCSHRHDTAGLNAEQLRQRQQVERRAASGLTWRGESLESTTLRDLDESVVARLATALVANLWRNNAAAQCSPAVLVGGDGHWTTAALVAAACRAVQLGGASAVEVGAVTSAALATAAAARKANAALWIGNARGAPHHQSVKFWRAGGLPASSPGELDGVIDCYASRPLRAKRSGGKRERFGAEEWYLARLEGLYHALRPLVLVLDTTCDVLARYWRRLAGEAACRIMHPSKISGAADGNAQASFVEQRLQIVAREVVASGAHFGMWIDGDAEMCHLVDERGRAVPAEQWFLLLAGYVCRQQSGAGVLLEDDASEELVTGCQRLGARASRGRPTRQGLAEDLLSTGALLGGGPSGRFWFAGAPPVADAFLSLSLLLSILSESDRPLSGVLDAATATG